MVKLTIQTFAAERNYESHIVPSLELTTGKPIPKWEDSDHPFDKLKSGYQQEAVLVVDAILKTMPQGLTDQILAELMLRKATVLSPPQRSSE